MRMKRGLLLAVLYIAFLGVQAQSNKDYFTIEGMIQVEGGTASQTLVVMSRNGKGRKEITPKPDGKYSVELEFQSSYSLEFSQEGYMTRRVNVNTTVSKTALEDGVMPFYMDIYLFKPFDGAKDEVPTVSFDEKEYSFRFDKSYMQTLKAQKKQVDQLKVGNDLELQANYDAAIKRGDASFNAKDYENAKTGYTDALKIKPDEQYPKTRLAEIDRILNELALKEKNEKELSAKYIAAINNGDAAFGKQDYTGAKNFYTEALGYKPGEEYPTKKIADIDRILNELALKEAGEKELKARYDAAIANGDAAFGKQDYTSARNYYNEAAGYKPQEKYPKDKIAEIDRILNELALKEAGEKEQKAKYDEAIKRGDAAFTGKNYSDAQLAYKEALTIKPGEQYPQTRLSEIEKLLNELALKEANEKELNARYEAAIVKGNSAFNSGDYAAARDAFKEALQLKPAEIYPKDKLAEAERILNELARKEANEKELNTKYDAAIKRGDDALAKQDYTNAQLGYKEALTLKPGETYPKGKLEEIDKVLQEQALKDQNEKMQKAKYDDAIKRGDAAFASKNYSGAKDAYNEALLVKPGETYPQTKITEIDKILSELALKEANEKELAAKYDAAVNNGNALFNAGNWSGAKTAFQEALTYKPNEKYPKDKIAEIDKIVAEIARKEAGEKELNAKYDAAVANGDAAFGKQDYKGAKTYFNEALGYKPAEQYPKDKIAEIDRLLAEIARKEALEKEQKVKYDDAVKRGDDAFKRKDYTGAISAYKEALGVKPEEKYPQDQLNEIDRIQKEIALREQQEKELKAKYDDAIKRGDLAFGNQKYADAKTAYQEALGLKPTEKYPKDKIAETDKILAEIALKEQKERELNANYDAAVKRGDDAFANKDYTAAKTGYNDALKLKPNEVYPQNKITEIDRILEEIAKEEARKKELRMKYEDAVKRGDDAFKNNDLANAKTIYTEALTYQPDEQYPKDQIKEIDRLEEERLKKEQEARLQAELERLRKLNNVTVTKTEEERQTLLKNGEKSALMNRNYVLLKPYDSVEQIGSQYFGYINFGGALNIEITKEEFDKYKVMFNK